MKIFKTKTAKIIIFIIIFVFVFTLNSFAENYNPSRAELEKMIEDVAQKRAIPSIIMKAIARVESVYSHFNKNGSPKITGTSIGLMQVNNIYGGYDTNRLKYDIMYNIEAGADVLLNKWSMSSYKQVSSVGDMDPNILENWYFALWAYNGWATTNNPNTISPSSKRFTYQQLVYDVIKKEYGGTVNNIDFSYLPANGKPSRTLTVPTPAYTNSGDIIFYDVGDYVKADGLREKYNLRDNPGGKYIHEIDKTKIGALVEGPAFKNGYYWYKIKIDDTTEGWIERNWILRVGDAELGIYKFEDIAFRWARKSIMNLYQKGIVSEASLYNPNSLITKEQFMTLFSKVINYGMQIEERDTDLRFNDASNISTWAMIYVKDLNFKGYLKDLSQELKPQETLSRKEATLIIRNLFGNNEEFKQLDIKTIFTDIEGLSDVELEAVKAAYTNGVVSGKASGVFYPNDHITRAEAASMIHKIFNLQEKIKKSELKLNNNSIVNDLVKDLTNSNSIDSKSTNSQNTNSEATNSHQTTNQTTDSQTTNTQTTNTQDNIKQ